ncbi:MAG: SH3 domain-containing protein [Bauldia sp.]|uniref:SH3 domain-containing protein n=1 Tax=Bauldia sp. TaxID=2575872 RepID=UPI001D2EC2E4|nr:SH3 domain-containing protein [Bauldia sp.]MCB1497475.1 SH3 domain-containing protein [Bauldia sp.]MCB1501578.1 SH3 domain-containing protein [Bauldia sp.]
MLNRIVRSFAAALVVVAGLAASALPGDASAFFAWRVADVPAWDTLNLRAWPSSGSKILVAYPNGTVLSMTGKCTGGVALDAINGWPKWKQREMVRTRWCEVWVDPAGNGQFRTAWVYGKYIAPL